MKKDLFCKSLSMWQENGLFYVENDTSCGILSVEPIFFGQGLIIPKFHVEKLSKLYPEQSKDFLSLPETFHEKILNDYKNNLDYLVSFYENLYDNPQTPKSKILASYILNSDQLNEIPIGFNTGINMGKPAGQLINHLHIHYIPRRESDKTNLGFLTAMNKLLNN